MLKIRHFVQRLRHLNCDDMGESVTADVEYLLDGKAPDVDKIVVDQKHSKESYVPKVKETVTYIAAAVLFNDHGEVLMVQEAKSSCRGKWYLPAGRMEQNETIEDAVKREVLEESGMIVEPTSLIYVESPGSGFWFRFTLTGNITGGSLKQLSQGDRESLQARWFSVDAIKTTVDLRAHDIIPLINIAVKFRSQPPVHSVRPIIIPHTKLIARLVILANTDDSQPIHLLTGLRGHAHLPTVAMDQVLFSIIRLIKAVFVSVTEVTPKLVGVLAVEHDGRPASQHDGLCLTLLLSLDVVASDTTFSDPRSFCWTAVEKPELIQRLRRLTQSPANLVDCRWFN